MLIKRIFLEVWDIRMFFAVLANASIKFNNSVQVGLIAKDCLILLARYIHS